MNTIVPFDPAATVAGAAVFAAAGAAVFAAAGAAVFAAAGAAVSAAAGAAGALVGAAAGAAGAAVGAAQAVSSKATTMSRLTGSQLRFPIFPFILIPSWCSRAPRSALPRKQRLGTRMAESDVDRS